MITNRQFDRFKEELNAIVEIYKDEFTTEKVIDWKTYELQWVSRLRTAIIEIRNVIDEADECITMRTKFGRRPETSAKSKALLLLLKDISQFSNRKMAGLLPLFSMTADVDTSYKTVERAYSNPLVKMIIHNMFVMLIKRRGIINADLTGDGTGYSLTVTKHYRTVGEKYGDKIKSNETEDKTKSNEKKKKLFTYAFALMDIQTWMYIGYGTSMRSERDAFNKAIKMMHECGIVPSSVRLDQYYGTQSISCMFDNNTTIFVIPKDNTTIRGPPEWKTIIKALMLDPFTFLSEYYKRENSESGFSADKRFDGWKIGQRLDDRIDTAVMCKGLWHNLLQLGRNI